MSKISTGECGVSAVKDALEAVMYQYSVLY